MKDKKGFIYIKSNKKSFKIKNLYKIGKTVDLNRRKNELSTGLPFPYTTEHSWAVSDIDSAERLIHKRLKKYQHSSHGGGRELFRGSLKQFIRAGEDLFVKNAPEIPDDDWWAIFRAACLNNLRTKVSSQLDQYRENGKRAIPRLYARLGSIGYRNIHSFYSWKHLKEELDDAKMHHAESQYSCKGTDPSILRPRPMDRLIVDYHPRMVKDLLSYVSRHAIDMCWREVGDINGHADAARKQIEKNNCLESCKKNRNKKRRDGDCVCHSHRVAANVYAGPNFMLKLMAIQVNWSKVYEDQLRKEIPPQFIETEKYIDGHTEPPWHERLFGAKPQPIYRDRDVYRSHEQRMINRAVVVKREAKEWIDHNRCPSDKYCWIHLKKGQKTDLLLDMERIYEFMSQVKSFAMDTFNGEKTFARLYDQNS